LEAKKKIAEGTETTLGKVILDRGPNSDPRQNRRQVKAVCLPSQVYRRPCFAESRTSAKINFCQRPFFADGWTLGKGPGCREEFFADGLALGKYGFADGLPLPRADSRQTFLCREPDIWLSAKTLALGNRPVSGSGCLMGLQIVGLRLLLEAFVDRWFCSVATTD